MANGAERGTALRSCLPDSMASLPSLRCAVSATRLANATRETGCVNVRRATTRRLSALASTSAVRPRWRTAKAETAPWCWRPRAAPAVLKLRKSG